MEAGIILDQKLENLGEHISKSMQTANDGRRAAHAAHAAPRRCEMGLAYLLKPLSLCPNPSGIFFCVMTTVVTTEWHPQSSRTFPLSFMSHGP